MKEVNEKNFGLVIAFMLPGFLLLWALTLKFPAIGNWFQTDSTKETASIGGFLNTALASLALGLLVSAIRWAILDWWIDWNLPAIDFSRLKEQHVLAAFKEVNEQHYRYYQYYSNGLIAVVLGFCVGYLPSEQRWGLAFPLIGVILLAGILLAASRDCLSKYRNRAASITAKPDGGP